MSTARPVLRFETEPFRSLQQASAKSITDFFALGVFSHPKDLITNQKIRKNEAKKHVFLSQLQ
jgi:hypothetical protein